VGVQADGGLLKQLGVAGSTASPPVVGFLSSNAGDGTFVFHPDKVHPQGSRIPIPRGVSVLQRQVVTSGFSLEVVIQTMSQQMEVQINSRSKLLDQAVKGQ
jgi:hypothetical protein